MSHKNVTKVVGFILVRLSSLNNTMTMVSGDRRQRSEDRRQRLETRNFKSVNFPYFEYRISSKEFRMMKFFSFDIHYSLFGVLRFSVY
jgi:hypothetical protein